MEKTRDQIEPQYQWDLTKIYPDMKAFRQEYDEVKQLISEYQKYEGHTMDDAQTFYQSVVDELTISEKLGILYTYTSLKSDEDIANNQNQELKSRVQNLYDYAMRTMYFTTPELLKVDYQVIEQFYQDEPRLLDYETLIKEKFRYQKHTLSDAEEKLLSQLSKAFGNDETVYNYLKDSDMSFGMIHDEQGSLVPLTNTNFSIYIGSQDRAVRKEAFETLYDYYRQFRNTITATFDGTIKQNVAIAKLRHYKSAFLASLYADDMDPKVYETLVATVHQHLDVFHQYLALRKEVLQLDEVHLYDVYADMIPATQKTYSFSEGKELVLQSLSILGEDYLTNLKRAFLERWIDIYPNQNKLGGAYSGGAYGTNPYVLLNYQGKIHDVSTLAHELGHSMHSFYTRNNQPYQYGDYPIFVAEVASTVNELLFAKYMLRHSTSKDEKLSILNSLLELFKGTIYRQVMFAEFEKYAYDLIEQDDVITADKLCGTYYDLNKQYFGDQVVVDEAIQYEWEKVPHFFSQFYVYKYATGLSAACKIVTDIEAGKEGALERYLEMLKSGSRQSPLETLKIAGVDMLDPTVVESAIAMFQDTIEEFKKEMNS